MVCRFELTAVLLLLTRHAGAFQTAPNAEINEKGNIITTEVIREGVRKPEA